MKEVEANKAAWGQLSKVHYEHYKKAIQDKRYCFSKIIEEELGNISGKTVIHLQCNTGADTVLLAQKGAIVTGVDLVPENISYDLGGMESYDNGHFHYQFYDKKLPFTFSLKARLIGK